MKRTGYALIESTGEYEDTTNVVIGVFMDKARAEQLKYEYGKKNKEDESQFYKDFESGNTEEDYFEPRYYYIEVVNVYE